MRNLAKVESMLPWDLIFIFSFFWRANNADDTTPDSEWIFLFCMWLGAVADLMFAVVPVTLDQLYLLYKDWKVPM